MGKSRVDPRKYGMSRAQVKGSWWFVVKCPDGSTSMCHYSPVTCIADVILKSGGDPSLHSAKYGSKTLDNDRCLEDYRINLNGSTILGDASWDGKLAVLTVSSKGVISAIRGKFSKKGAAGGSGGGTTYDLVLLGARGLVAADKSGTSDPYVVVSFAGEVGGRAKSSTIKKTLDPVWQGSGDKKDQGEALSVRGPPRDEAVLKVQVFDANVIQRDVLLGEAEVDLGRLYKEVQYHTYFMRAVLVPLAPQGWLSFAWKTADQQDVNRDHLVLEPGFGFAAVELAQEQPDQWAPGETVPVLSYHSSLRGVVRFLEAKLYEAKRAETPGAVLKIAAQFGEGDSWSELSARWTPELLAQVSIFALEVKAGHSPDEVSALLAVVKASPSITEVHLLDFDRSDAMEHGIQALKGAPHIARLKYSDDQHEVNDDGATSVAELVTELPALTSLELVPGNGMLESQFLPKLLGVVAGLKLKSLTLTDLPSDSGTVDLSALVKTTAAESLAIRFKYSFDFSESLIWTSVVDSLKESPVRRLAVEHRHLTSAAAAKQLVEAVLEMPSVEEFRATVKSEVGSATLPLLSSPKLKGLSLRVEGKTNADSFVQAVGTNQVLERLQLEGDLEFTQSTLGKLAEENSTLKVLLLGTSYTHRLSYCDSAALKRFASNTTLTTADLSIWKLYDAAFRDQVAEVASAWEARGATFST